MVIVIGESVIVNISNDASINGYTKLLTNRFRGLHLLNKSFSYIDRAKYKNADETEL